MCDQSPIQKLPDDVLHDTFLYIQPLGDITAWLAIPTVCRRWRAICLASALYWRHILMVNPTYLQIILERSREAPLSLKIDVDADDMDCIALLEGHIYHTRYLNIRSSTDGAGSLNALREIKNMLQQPMPQVRGLCLHFQHVGGQYSLDDALLPSLPALRLLDLRGIHLNWAARGATFGQLTSLHLEPLDLADMCGALTKLPSLREVAVVIYDPPSGGWLPPPKSMIWPKMEYLDFLCSPNAARMFWDALSVPDTARLTWRVREPPMGLQIMPPQYEALLRDLVRTFMFGCSSPSVSPRQLPGLALISEETSISLDLYEDTKVHVLPDRSQQSSPAPCALSIKFMLPFHFSAIRAVPFDGVQSLCIDEQCPSHQYRTTVESDHPALLILPHLRDLRVLVLRSYRKDSAILRFMATNDGAETDDLLLPQLEHIIIEHTDMLTGCGQELLDYLERRTRLRQSLKRLTIRKCTMSSHKVAELDAHVREPVSWDYISTYIPL